MYPFFRIIHRGIAVKNTWKVKYQQKNEVTKFTYILNNKYIYIYIYIYTYR